MYDIVKAIISHTWNSSQSVSSTEQSAIYYICGTIIILMFLLLVDWTFRLFRDLIHHN